MSSGFVYIMSNPSMPGIYKVGKSTKVPTERADELRSTGVPTDFVVEYYAFSNMMNELERDVHKDLASYRINPNREFFKCSPYIIIKSIQELDADSKELYKSLDMGDENPSPPNVLNRTPQHFSKHRSTAHISNDRRMEILAYRLCDLPDEMISNLSQIKKLTDANVHQFWKYINNLRCKTIENKSRIDGIILSPVEGYEMWEFDGRDVLIEDSSLESKDINYFDSGFIHCTLCQNTFLNETESTIRVCPKCDNNIHLSNAI